MAFDVEGARAAGYTDAEIARHLADKGIEPPPGTTWRGAAKNVAAGVLDTAANVGNFLSDPSAAARSAIGIIGGTAYDAGARSVRLPSHVARAARRSVRAATAWAKPTSARAAAAWLPRYQHGR